MNDSSEATAIQAMTADHRLVVSSIRKRFSLPNPVALNLDKFEWPLLKNSQAGEMLPIDGLLVRDWDRDNRKTYSAVLFGVRVYRIQDFVYFKIMSTCDDQGSYSCYNYYLIDQSRYAAFFRLAKTLLAKDKVSGPPPVLSPEILKSLRRNTIDFLEPKNLDRIQSLGGRAKRGLLLSGPPGNGKTSACRWIREQCDSLGFDSRIVSPDDYRQARNDNDPSAAIKRLFTFDKAGVVFFDDLDIAMRDREKSGGGEDQAVFLSALDGIEINRGVVSVFTSNLAAEAIDKAFLRPGRIDACLYFPKPTRELRQVAIERWSQEILACLDMSIVLDQTEAMSFADLEELKNLMIFGMIENNTWNWTWAFEQFRTQRRETVNQNRVVGFAAALPTEHEKYSISAKQN